MKSLIEIMILFTSCRTLENMLHFLKASLGDRRDVSDNEIIEIIGRVCDVSGTCWDQAMNWHWSHEEIQAVYTCTVRVYTCTVRGQDQVSSTGGFYTGTRIKAYNASPSPNLDGFQSFFLLSLDEAFLMFNFAFCWLIKKPLWINELWGQLLGSRLCYYYR